MLRIHFRTEPLVARTLPDFASRWLDTRGIGRRRPRRSAWAARVHLADTVSIRRLLKGLPRSGSLGVLSVSAATTGDRAGRSSAVPRLATALILVAGAAALVRIAVVPWARAWGRRAEDTGPLPGDDIVDETTAIETRSIDINASPEEVWPWLVQMGYGRAGWYSYDALDTNMPSTKVIRPELTELKVGDLDADPPGWRVPGAYPRRAEGARALSGHGARSRAGRGSRSR